ncbi:GA module-containing protein [Smaragdicoccus niigatensis]|uniref:GA module-containing protein n=1 Tax=Smaragdicoccus niigatensis TaxID=359359 RepID=UPI00035FF185|nr:GA module-containing protein [Smaragdicoccus niigatensis]
MSTGFLLLLVIIGVVAFLVIRGSQAGNQRELDDAVADARQAIDRLGGQVYNLTGSNDAAKQALSDASERFTAAGSQISQAKSAAQARLAKQTAIEGLYYIRAARTAMGMDPGPHIPELTGQRTAGAVSENRSIAFEGRQIQASPGPSQTTPNYYPGGMVAGRPVPAGWYSEPWWKTALVAGAWGVGSMLLFDALFSGMHGVGYDQNAFADGYQDGFQDASGNGDVDPGDAGDGGGFFDGFDSFDF